MTIPYFYGQEDHLLLTSLLPKEKAIKFIVGEPTTSSIGQLNQNPEQLQKSYFRNATALDIKYRS
ncbi:hypothetical protein DSO57_1017794 [Entomophthora muscae]|uniref:Uncharacterized protein n=1 Tax=Entomophthora muscae TaxID=34485 RepID=A0ACC2RVK3_9FUNG|nr:hypothetical protein DSO57_1017794 [Entomophthora muscae]